MATQPRGMVNFCLLEHYGPLTCPGIGFRGACVVSLIGGSVLNLSLPDSWRFLVVCLSVSEFKIQHIWTDHHQFTMSNLLLFHPLASSSYFSNTRFTALEQNNSHNQGLIPGSRLPYLSISIRSIRNPGITIRLSRL